MEMNYQKLRRFFLLVVIGLSALPNSGCIEGHDQVYYRYDKQKDSFAYLHVFTDIAARKSSGQSEKSMQEYLFALTKKKEDIFIYPLPAFLGPPGAFVRLGPRTLHSINLSNPPVGFKDTLEFSKSSEQPLDLSAIKIEPGVFFLNERKNLCYSHEIEVPGALVDQVLLAWNKSETKELDKAITDLIKVKDDPASKERVMSWDALRAEIATKIRAGSADISRNRKKEFSPAVNPEPKDAQIPVPFEVESLKRLLKGAKQNGLGITRKGSRLRIELPLTKKDAQETIATLNQAKGILLEELAKQEKEMLASLKTENDRTDALGNLRGLSAKDVKRLVESMRDMVKKGFVYDLGRDQGVFLEFDLARLFALVNLMYDLEDQTRHAEFLANPNVANLGMSKATVDFLQGRGIEIARMLDEKKLRSTYVAPAK